MEHARDVRNELAHGLVRDRSSARRRGDDHAGPVPVARRVTVYHAVDCGLCVHALEVVGELQPELGFRLEVVDIAGDDELERLYRVRIPVVSVDGDEAFEYFVDPDALRARLLRS